MDDLERIPIDLSYEVAAAAEPSDPRTTMREAGTLVIDILVPQPCSLEPSTGGEIVVCAQVPDNGRPPPAPPTPGTARDTFGEALHARIGPLELGSIANRNGTRFWRARVRF